MIKILCLMLTENYGGIERFLLNVLSNIDRNKFHLDFVSNCDNPAYKSEIEDYNSKIYNIRNINLTNLCNQYDIIHFNKNSLANILPIIDAKRTNAKIIIHSHNSAPTSGHLTYFLHYLNRLFVDSISDLNLACSNYAGKWMFPSGNYLFLPNGINTKQYLYSDEDRISLRNKYQIDSSSIVLGNIGRLENQKNQLFLLKIFYDFNKIYTNSKLLIIGSGKNESKLKLFAKKIHIIDNVIFVKNTSKISMYLSFMDYFILTSKFEGFPIVSIESQASGLPTFLPTNITPEIDISNSINWFSLETDPKDIAKHIISVNPNLPEERILKNDIIQKSIFDISNTVKYLSHYYESL